MKGDAHTAEREYAAALAVDPQDAFAAGNLALIEAQNHQVQAAVQLLKKTTADDPGEVEAGMNLAVLECDTGEPDRALETLDGLLRFAPDDDRARAMATEIRAGKLACGHR